MAFTKIELIYVVEMTNVEFGVVTTLPSAYISLDAAYGFIEKCKRADKKDGTTDCWTYRVRPITLLR